MTGPHAREYKIAMHKDISQLINQSKWCMINHNTLQKLPNGKYPVLPVTQALNIKRLSDWSPLKIKARYCVWGDKQTEGVDYFKTYAPVVSWSNVCLALTLILSNGLRTKQVDYTNYFSQSYLKEKNSLDVLKELSLKLESTRFWNWSRSYMGSNKLHGNSLDNSRMYFSD